MTRRIFWCWAVLFPLLPAALYADTLRGVVKDEQGQPVAGARVDVATAAPKVGRGIFCPSRYLDCRKWTRTNAQGEFVIQGLDAKLKFQIISTAPGKQSKLTNLIDPSVETATLVLPDFPADVPETQILQGIVVSSDGMPIPGAFIEPFGAKTPRQQWLGPVEAQATVSDDEGHFKLLISAPDYLGLDVRVLADGFAGTRRDQLTPGDELHRIEVPNGTAVTGKLVYLGKPQAGLRVAVAQTNRGSNNYFIRSVLAITDNDGRFQFNFLPANQQYAIFSPVGATDERDGGLSKKLLTTKAFNCRDNNESRDLGALELSDSYSMAGRLEMSDGTRLPDGVKLWLNRDPAWDSIEVPIDPEGRFAMAGLPPETYELTINVKGVRLDNSRLNFQMVRPNTFAMRLTQTCDNILIPLRHVESEASRKADAKNEMSSASEPKPTSTDEFPEIAPIVAGAQGGSRFEWELADEPVPADGPRLRVRGTVVTAKGVRIAGATVVLRAKVLGQIYSQGVLHNRDILARTTSDANGRFVFGNIPIPLRFGNRISSPRSGSGGAQVLAFADGYGMNAADVDSMDGKVPLRVVLGPEADVKGIVRDESGTGIAGARIELLGLTGLFGPPGYVLNGPGEIGLMASQLNRFSTADREGKFLMKHMPRDCRLIVSVTAEQCVRKVMVIETTLPRDGIPKRSDVEMFEDRIPVQQSPVEIALEATPTLKVKVVDHDGTPIPDGVVEFLQFDGEMVKSRQVNAIQNETGIVTFETPHAGQLQFLYAADPMNPRIWVTVSMKDSEIPADQMIELRLPRTRWVTGRVVSSETGKPVVGAMVDARWQGSNEPGSAVSSCAVSRENGQFRIPAAIGENRIEISGDLYGFDTMSENAAVKRSVVINVTKAGDPPDVKLTLSPGLILEGTVRNEDGEPVSDVLVKANRLQGSYQGVATHTNIDGKYRIAGLSPFRQNVLTVVAGGTAEQKIIEGVAAKEGQQVSRETVDMTLKRGVQLRGRVMKDGQPQSGVKIELIRSLSGGPIHWMDFLTTTTDQEGRYLVGGLDPGDGYQFKLITRDGLTAPDWGYEFPFEPEIPADETGIIELPDANLVSNNQSLAGTIVDPDGNPVAGITVDASLSMGGHIEPRENSPPPTAVTDQAGRFQLTQLPDDELELEFYRDNPGAGSILILVRMIPDRNQANVRIVIDRRLSEGVEDLDQDKDIPTRGNEPLNK